MEGNLVKGIQDTITDEVLPPDFKDRMQIMMEYAMPPKDFQEYVEESDKYKWRRLHQPNTARVKEGMENRGDGPIETIAAIEEGMGARHGTFKSDGAFAQQCAENAEATTAVIIEDEKADLNKLKKYYSTYLTLYKSMYNYQLSLGSLIDGKLKELNKFSNKIDTYTQNLYIDSRKDNYENSNYDFYKRQSKHKSCCNNNKNSSKKEFHLKVYVFIRENGGFDNWLFEILEYADLKDKDEAEKLEGHYIEIFNPTLNKNDVGLTPEEKAEKDREYNKKRREDPEFRKKEAERSKKRREDPELKKKDAAKKKESIKEKITCVCGTIHTMGAKAKHLDTLKHKAYVKNNPQEA
jgi:hypothetical protein